jgi:hypothetical protein
MDLKGVRMLMILFSLLASSMVNAADAEVVYLQSQTTQLRAEPKAGSPTVLDLKRGDQLAVLKKEGLWLQVKTTTNSEGWVPKILTSTIKPLAQAQLLKDSENLDTKAKSSRRRTTDYAVSAATRGLSAGERHRPGDENFRSNRKAVDELEKIKLAPEQVKKFKEEASITPQ